MALQHTIFVRGKVGPVIFYERDGIGYARAAPQKVRQTKATKESAQLFGKAARIAKVLRRNTSDVCSTSISRKAMIRLNQAVQAWLMGQNTAPQNEIHRVTDFEFNLEKELTSTLKCNITAGFTGEGEVNVTIPALQLLKDVKAPVDTKTIHFHVFVNTCRVSDHTPTGEDYCEIRTPFQEGTVPEQKVSLSFDASEGCMTVVIVALQFTTGKHFSALPMDRTEWLPMRIVAACYR